MCLLCAAMARGLPTGKNVRKAISRQSPLFPGTTQKKPSLAHHVPEARTCFLFYGPAFLLLSNGEHLVEVGQRSSLRSEPLQHLIEGENTNPKSIHGIKQSFELFQTAIGLC